jgi:hypothetical protein
MPTFHHVFGLQLRATKPIPGLVALPSTPSAQASDLSVWLGAMPPGLRGMEAAQKVWYVSPYHDERGEPNMRVWTLDDGAYFRLYYSDGTDFVVDRQGRNVWATWAASATLEDTATYLLGPILGFVLRLRGVVCLHASAIALGDRVVAVLGPGGAGKSTTAAAFAQRGHAVLSDDVLALSDQADGILVQPAYPRIRLWPSSVGSLYGSLGALPRLTPSWDKRYLDLTTNGYQFEQQPLPLAAIYMLAARSTDPLAPFAEAEPAQRALVSLVTNSYVNYLLDQEMRAREFELLARIIARVPIRRLTPHADAARLQRLCDVILADFEALTSPVS